MVANCRGVAEGEASDDPLELVWLDQHEAADKVAALIPAHVTLQVGVELDDSTGEGRSAITTTERL